MPIDRQQTLQTVKTALSNLTTARGLRTRPSQNQMISAIAQTLLDACDGPPEKGSNLVAVEAPTGTGKSFGYLLPSIPIAKAADKKIVVATAVVSLQEQLVSKDLPAMQAALPVPFTFAIAKGRSRFVCPSRLKDKTKELLEQGHKPPGKDATAADQFSVGGGSPKEDEANAMFAMLNHWETKKWNGEQESIMINEEQRKVIWPKVTTDSAGCSGKACKEHKACPYLEARAKWQMADVIVANHDLVMSDLKIGAGGAILSEPENTIYIFDEAHHLPNKARDAWAHSFKTDTFPRIIREIPINLNDTGLKWSDDKCSEAKRIGGKMLELKVLAQAHGKEMDTIQKEMDKAFQKLTAGVAPRESFVIPYTSHYEDLMEICDRYKTCAESMQSLTNQVLNEINKARFNMVKNGQVSGSSPLFDDSEMNRVLGAFGFYNSRLMNLVETLTLFSKEQPEPSHPPIAKWLVPDDKHKSFSVHATHTMATDLLPRNLYDRAFSVIHASATLTSSAGFALFKQKTGLCYYPNTRTLKLDSPFDFKKNATLAFGDLGVNPSDAEKHTQRLVETLPIVFEKKPVLGTLVLFSSKSQLEQVAARLPAKYRALCKVQYEAPNASLIDAHKADVDAGKKSILMGTQSFSEGLDLPGAWCSHVISTKLPFSMPDNPIDKTLSAWMESQGRSVFREIAVPEASERVIQQSGRLLRNEDDSGQFTVLDSRLKSKWTAYGRAIVEALPPFARTTWDLTKDVYKDPTTPAVGGQNKPAPAAVAKGKGGLPELAEYDVNMFSNLGDDAPW